MDDFAVNETQPSSLEELEHLIGQQHNFIKQLDGQRTTIVSLLQKVCSKQFRRADAYELNENRKWK